MFSATAPRQPSGQAPDERPDPIASASMRAIATLVARHGEPARPSIEAGVARVAARWQPADGTPEEFETFCTRFLVVEPSERQRLLARIETAIEQVDGHLYEMRRMLRRHHDLRGDEFPGVDEILAQFDPAPDLSEQVYRQKLAHLALLNFPRPTLERMLAEGPGWDLDAWAAARVALNFGPRIPVEVADRARKVAFEAGRFVSDFHVPVGGLVDAQGGRWFDPERRLIAHWLVREEIRAGYGDPDGIRKQRALSWVMARHVDGSIPRAVMSGEERRAWDPATNRIAGAPPGELLGLGRYEHWIACFRMAQELDRFHPEEPTAIARKFVLERE
ncbi:MAG: hypothetical protein EBU70_15645, partial [Actinobacteria bacterium]|nr:hypothetical protein [Actinomycetota bacterium]